MIRIFIVLFLAVLLKQLCEVEVVTNDETKRLMPPIKGIERFSMGYNNFVADILWLRVIQDFSYCEQGAGDVTYNPGVTFQQALEASLNPSRCDRGWVYQMLEAITDTAARFHDVYRIGAINLSVAVDDREGARLIFEKGLKQFPDDWSLAYAASYHYLFEIQNADRAADLLLQANRYGGPTWLPVLASRLYSAAGRSALGKSVLEEYLKTQPKGEGLSRARARLKQLNN